MSATPIILTETKDAVGIITLNAESSLNALSLDMAQALLAQLKKWNADDSIAMIVLQGAGEKAFCAGGDVRKIFEAKQSSHGYDYAAQFFETEYRTDYAIHTSKKPVLAYGHGIVMGGGIGLLAGAKCRVLTERSLLAMPEITIGLYPDVGGTYFLNRMPGKTGLYLGLTGTRLNAADALYIGLGDFFVAHKFKNELIAKLADLPWSEDPAYNTTLMNTCVSEVSGRSQDLFPVSEVQNHQSVILDICQGHSFAEIYARFVTYADNPDKWITSGVHNLLKGSPSSAMLIFEQLKRGKNLKLKEAFQQELVLSLQCFLHNDFCEGVRALLVDKDQKPQWQPAQIKDVTHELIDTYFQPPWGNKTHPLANL